jgi:SPP1 family predicted phage head-tail adaptor
MNIGKKRKKVQVQQVLRLQVDSGEVQTTFSNLGERRWAEIKPLNGRELARAQQLSADATVEIRLRYSPDITESMRVVHTPRVAFPNLQDIYDILSVIHVNESYHETVLTCSKSTFDGHKTGGSNA